jgi:hypothetical protein
LDYEVIWCATSMPGDARSIQLKRPHKTRPRRRACAGVNNNNS